MTIDLQSRARISRMDAFLLLLEARNHVQFREEEWKWSPTMEQAREIWARTCRTLQDAMFRVRSAKEKP